MYSAIYETTGGRQLALDLRPKNAKILIESVPDIQKLPFSTTTKIEKFPPSRPRSHFPAPNLVGPYKERPGKDAILVRPASETDFKLLLNEYAQVSSSSRFTAIPKPQVPAPILVQPEDDESAFPEGAAAYKLHRSLERDPSLSRRAKEHRVREKGRLTCDVCDFDFSATYGTLGDGFIEAHHINPVSSLDGVTTTKLSDLLLVCSNCHRMLHRSKPLITPSELKARLCNVET
jgi:hypothetical protein